MPRINVEADRIWDACDGGTSFCPPPGEHSISLYFYRGKVKPADGITRVGVYCAAFANSLVPQFEVQLIDPPPEHLIADLVARTLARGR